MTEKTRLEYNKALLAWKAEPNKENKARLDEAKEAVYQEINNNFLASYRVFERQQGI